MKKIIATLLYAVSFAPISAVPVSAQTNWTGPFFGASVAHSKGSVKEVTGISGAGESTDNTNARGYLFGVHAGYNYQFNNKVVIGLETELQQSNVASSRTLGDATTGTLQTTTKLNWVGTTSVLVGYAGIDRFLPYLKVGGAYGSFKKTDVIFDFLKNTVTEGAVGYAVGAGLSYALSRNLSISGEYLITKLYVSNTQSELIGSGGTWGVVSDNIWLTSKEARLGFQYRF